MNIKPVSHNHVLLDTIWLFAWIFHQLIVNKVICFVNKMFTCKDIICCEGIHSVCMFILGSVKK